MKMTRRQLRSLIMETINRRHLSESTQGNPIAGFELDGKYYTNQDLQSLGVEDEWWWSQAAAQGLWFSEDEAEAKLKGRFDELQERFDAEFNEDRPNQGSVEAGEPDIKFKGAKRVKALFRKRSDVKSDRQAATKQRQPEKASNQTFDAFRDLNKLQSLRSDDYGPNQGVFSDLVDRFFIAVQMKNFNSAEASKMMNLVKIDIEDLTDVTSYAGAARYSHLYGELIAAAQKHGREVNKINAGLKEKVPNIKILAGDEAGGIEGEIEGNKSEDLIYTLENDETYAYRKNPDTPLGWEYALQKDLKAGKSSFKPIKGGKSTLNNALSGGTLRPNPLFTSELNESLSRGSLYRRRYHGRY